MGNAVKLSDRPWFTISGWLIGAVGLVLSVIFYFTGQQYRRLIFAESLSRSTLVNKDRPGSVKVLHDGKEITDRDVVAADITFWNEGRASIKAENCLTPTIIRLESPAEILDASITRSTRAVIEPKVTRDPGDARVLLLEFRILEHRDAFTLQIVYAGDPDAEISVGATIEGQGSPFRLTQEQLTGAHRSSWEAVKELGWTGLTSIFFGVIGGGLLFRVVYFWKRNPELDGRTRRPYLIIGFLAVFGTALTLLGILGVLAAIGSVWLIPAPPL